MTDTERNIIALIDKRIAFAEQMTRSRPHEHSQWRITLKQFETLREEFEQGLHMPDKSLAA